jgi:hypothetical protein
MGRAKALMMEMEETLWEPSDVSFFVQTAKKTWMEPLSCR